SGRRPGSPAPVGPARHARPPAPRAADPAPTRPRSRRILINLTSVIAADPPERERLTVGPDGHLVAAQHVGGVRHPGQLQQLQRDQPALVSRFQPGDHLRRLPGHLVQVRDRPLGRLPGADPFRWLLAHLTSPRRRSPAGPPAPRSPAPPAARWRSRRPPKPPGSPPSAARPPP